jgi:hypothetical protein
MPITIPNVKEPLSPIKIFAGYQLNNRNERSVTIKNEESEISNSSLNCKPTAKKVPSITIDIVDANPSNPSIKFNAFVNPAIAKNVNGKTHQIGKTISYPKYVPNEYMAKSFKYKNKDEKKIKENFVLGVTFFISSQIPTINTNAIEK